MRIFLTGAGGFLGGHLAVALSMGGHEVRATDRCAGADDAWLALDLRDRTQVSAALADWPAELVIHAGALSGAMLAAGDPAWMFDVNAGGTLAVLEAMRLSGVSRLIHLSSNAVYRAQLDRAPLSEQAPLGSAEPYCASKVAAEAMVCAYAATAGIDAWMLRVSSIYGPGRRTACLISALREGGRGEPVVVTDERSNLRQLVHVSDVVRAVLAAVSRPARGCVAVNVAGSEYLSELAIAQLAAEHLPGLQLQVVADRGVEVDGRHGPLALDLAATRLGWRPEVDLRTGLAALLGRATADTGTTAGGFGTDQEPAPVGVTS